MATATPVRRIEAPDLVSDDDLLAQGLIDEDVAAFDHDPVPGEIIVHETNIEGDAGAWIKGTMTGDDPTQVAIYDIDGRRFSMPKDWALMRLQKRYARNHPQYPGRPVFYKRPPKVFPTPTFPCPAEWGGGCRKMLFSRHQQSIHFRQRHKLEWEAREDDRKRDLEERGVRAAERQAELMERLLSGGVAPAAIQATQEVVEVIPAAPAEQEEAEVPFGVPDATWERAPLIAWLKANELPLPERWIHMKQVDVWKHVKGLIGE